MIRIPRNDKEKTQDVYHGERMGAVNTGRGPGINNVLGLTCMVGY